MVVQAAVPALEISHTSRLPASVPVDDRSSYFELQKSGHFWEAITDESAVALFLPYDRSEIEVELLLVKRP
jgi:predicted component of type VI protein secretion system